MYLERELIRSAFNRFREAEAGGKKGLERASALMYFLAFDSLCKRLHLPEPVNMDAGSSTGKTHREGLILDYTKLVLVGIKGNGVPCHVMNLGTVTVGGNSPEKRISSNFLTVPLKKATTSTKKYEYPNRPRPLLLMGPKATGITWGMMVHPDWEVNLPIFMAERSSFTPFHDLAIFILRDTRIQTQNGTLQAALSCGLMNLFSDRLCALWNRWLALERKKKGFLPDLCFQESPPAAFRELSWADVEGDSGSQYPKELDRLKERIEYLEGLLRIRRIPFDGN